MTQATQHALAVVGNHCGGCGGQEEAETPEGNSCYNPGEEGEAEGPIPTRASLVAHRLKRLPAMWETWVQSLGREDSPGEGNGDPLQYSCLENPMDRGTWWATVHGVTKSRTRLSDFIFTYTQSREVIYCGKSTSFCFELFKKWL